ncbi:MAG: hypothetical protein H6R10_349 [Rhodocyclaceae bacterium]|nr:hypothetical protein [Rhodocyclaceae bacterium]
MAQIIPDGWREVAVTGAARREVDTLSRLARALPAAYTVYHAVHWTNIEHNYAVFGEIDFVVVNRAGDILLIEQKSGFLDETAEGLVMHYPGKVRNVPVQMSRMVSLLRGKLAARPDVPSVHIDALLYCPDYRVRNPHTAGLNPERIVDAGRRDQLIGIIQAILPEGEETPTTQKIHRFFRDVIQLDSDVSALMGYARDLVTRISGGLAHWARQLEFTPFRLRVIGTAGSGKTQLALAEYRDTLEAGKRPLYVSYNRPLADHFARIAPAGGLICNFHQLCDRRVRAAGDVPDFAVPGAFDRLLQRAFELPIGEDFLFDVVIIDEGQDFSAEWRDFVFRHARPDARLFWLEDPLQNLYGREPLPFPGWVSLHARSNYRSPRAVIRMLEALLPSDVRIEAASPFTMGEVEFITYGDTAGLLQGVKEAIRRCYSEGYKRHDVAIVSYHGREHSQLMGLNRLGTHTLKHFTGQYDLFGQPVFSEGELLLESVYRFKGQAAPAIIFAEIDFETLDGQTVRKLFVGATRAMLKLVLVIHEWSAQLLRERLGAAP